MKTLFAIALAAGALGLAAPAHADITVGPDIVVGPDVQVGPGISDPQTGGAAPIADALDASAQAAAGRPPCISPDGTPYYTAGDAPCN